jgi:iron complex outermembrane receptor protein
MNFHRKPVAAGLAACLSSLFADDLLAQAAPAQQSLAPVFVTARPLGADLFELVDPVNVLEGQALFRKTQPTLGETLSGEVGVTSTYFGPNASRPIIRGLGGFDIRLLNNGIGLLDASASSPDHAVAVAPIAIDRVEVIRGPAAVMYGGSAVGGVVNTIDGRIPQAALGRPVQGAGQYRFDSSNNGQSGEGRIDVGNDRLVLHGDAFVTNNQNLKIPGSAWTGAVQALRNDPGPTGTLPNSQGKTYGGGVGASVLFGDKGYAGISYSQFNSDYGTVAEPDVTIDMRQWAWNFAGELRNTVPFIEALRVKYGYNNYQHTEFEGPDAGTQFASNGWNLRVEAQHQPIGAVRGAVGFESANVKFSALGDEAFVPSTKTTTNAGFIYEELPWNAWTFSAGGRIASTKVDADPFDAAGLPGDSRSFTPLSGALGAFYAFNREWGVGVNYAYTERAPTFQELYADGPHIATNAFEVGNRNFNMVKSNAVDVTLKWQKQRYLSTLGVFYNRFNNYVGLFPTGILRDPETRGVVDPATATPDELDAALEQYDYAQVSARFYGIEGQVTMPVYERAGRVVTLQLQADYVNARDTTNSQPLPFMPPFRFGTTLGYQQDRFTASLGGLFAAAQTRVPQNQTETPGWANVFASAAYRLPVTAGFQLEAFLQANNLLDQTIRYSTSFLKDIAPLGQRAVVVGVRGTF